MQNKIRKNKYGGFSLMELLVAIFIFSLVIMVVVSTFLRVANVRKRAKAIQQNLEDARSAAELMAKTLRISSIISAPGSAANIQFFENSQGRCMEYVFNSNRLQYRIGSGADKASCDFTSAAFSDVTNGFVMGNFFVVPTSPAPAIKIGKVTITVEVCSDVSCSAGKARAQTTVSLRDYNVVNP